MIDNKNTLYAFDSKGTQYLKFTRPIREQLTARLMRVADRDGLSDRDREFVVKMISAQLRLIDWTRDDYERFDRVWRSNRSTALPFVVVEFNALSKGERSLIKYDSLVNKKTGARMDIPELMKYAAKDAGIDLEDFCRRHGLDLGLEARTAQEVNSGRKEAKAEIEFTNPISETLTAIVYQMADGMGVLIDEVRELRKVVEGQQELIGRLMDRPAPSVVTMHAPGRPANARNRSLVSTKLAAMRGRVRPVE